MIIDELQFVKPEVNYFTLASVIIIKIQHFCVVDTTSLYYSNKNSYQIMPAFMNEKIDVKDCKKSIKSTNQSTDQY